MKRIRRIVALILALGCVGCSGMEIGTKAWIQRRDEHSESMKTHQRPIPMRCYFTNCADTQEAQGS